MHQASIAMAEGADFILIGATYTMLESVKPVISICAVRTGCGKSQTTREVCRVLRGMDKKIVVVRHPMPYGDLKRQAVQRFSSYDDFEKTTLHHRRAGGIRTPWWPRALWFMPGSITRPF